MPSAWLNRSVNVGRGDAQAELGTHLGGEMTLEPLDEAGSTCTLPSSPRVVEKQPLEIGEERARPVVSERIASLSLIVPFRHRLSGQPSSCLRQFPPLGTLFTGLPSAMIFC